MHENGRKEELLSNDENKNGENATTPINTDPFASVREEEEEKIEQMLLLPDTSVAVSLLKTWMKKAYCSSAG